MPSVNEVIADAAIGHAVDLAQYGNGVVRRMLALLNRADQDLFLQLTAALERAGDRAFAVERLESLLMSVRALNLQAYRAIERELTAELRNLVEYEAQYQYELFRSTLPAQVVASVNVFTVNAEQVYSAAMARPFALVRDGMVPMSEYLAGLEAWRATAIKNAVRLGFVESEGIDRIVRRIRGTKAANYADGLMEGPRHHIEGMVRTAINHTANFTRQRFFEANSDVVQNWKFTAVLDGRTSITCASLANKVFPIGKGPMPPRHINCRSLAVPITVSWRSLGIDMDELEPGTRSSMDGQVPADITFTEWLRKKGAGTQDEILGATRGRLFRENKIEVDRFTDNKGRVYSLDQLRKRDAELFRKAGV